MKNNKPFDNIVFNEALEEMKSIRFRVSRQPEPGYSPYIVFSGRSNHRWWLIPKTFRKIMISSFALYQPVIFISKLLKWLGLFLTGLGFSSFLRKTLYVSEKSLLPDIFKGINLHFAFFTGTHSSHRKTTVQVMDSIGSIKGYAKITLNPSIKSLLTHEAETLNRVQKLDLNCALVPKVLYCGKIGQAWVLATDSLKTICSKTFTILTQTHISFLKELSEKTIIFGTNNNRWLIKELNSQYKFVSNRLSIHWQQRLKKSLEYIASHKGTLGKRSLSHGDFTPWNTFIVNDKLYVFDWEYASDSFSPNYDLIHFILSLPSVKRQTSTKIIFLIRKQLKELKIAQDNVCADILFLSYLCGRTLQFIAREKRGKSGVVPWDGEQQMASLIDVLFEQKGLER